MKLPKLFGIGAENTFSNIRNLVPELKENVRVMSLTTGLVFNILKKKRRETWIYRETTQEFCFDHLYIKSAESPHKLLVLMKRLIASFQLSAIGKTFICHAIHQTLCTVR